MLVSRVAAIKFAEFLLSIRGLEKLGIASLQSVEWQRLRREVADAVLDARGESRSRSSGYGVNFRAALHFMAAEALTRSASSLGFQLTLDIDASGSGRVSNRVQQRLGCTQSPCAAADIPACC